MNRLLGILLLMLALSLASCRGAPATPDIPPADEVQTYTYEVVNSYPHDSAAFTQGLVFNNGFLYESTGREANSTLRRVDLESGQILQVHHLPSDLFGEGITILVDKIIQLTWLSRTGFVYDKDSFEQLSDFNYETEGWGITTDGERLIMSDGTATLYFLDPNSFQLSSTIQVSDDNSPVDGLNELEYINGLIYANVWRTDQIVMVSPATGKVTGWIDLTGLLEAEYGTEGAGTLNGIAYDGEGDRLFVTGKLWPRLFEIKLIQLK
jgi:glutamine cyclotransferase